MKKVLPCLAFVVLSTVLFAVTLYAEVRCVNAPGEAAIIGNDVYSAKEEAMARAKWRAIEAVTDLEIRGERVVQNNMRIVDEAAVKKFNGIIKQYEVLQETQTGDTSKVLLRVCVETTRARQAVESLSMNSSLVVFVPAKRPGWCKNASGYEEANVFTETLIEGLASRGYIVHDILPPGGTDTRGIEDALSDGRFLSFRNFMYRHLSNILIIGKIDHSRGKPDGEEIGYGLAMPSNCVKARLYYRIVKKDDNGKMAVLTAGTEMGKGFGQTLCDAATDSLKDLAEQAAPSIARKLQQHITGIAKKVTVRVANITDLNTNFEVKGIIQNSAWVTAVEEAALGEFIVTYTENSIYLANSLVQKNTFRLLDFTPDRITVAYER